MSRESNVISGKYYAGKIAHKLTEKVSEIHDRYGIRPGLAIVVVGNNPISAVYIHNKLRAASQIGINTIEVHLPENTPQDELVTKIRQLNHDPEVSGIIVQLPLPFHINKTLILLAIAPEKDVDGFHPVNVGYLHSGEQPNIGFIPCTALGCLELLKQCEPDLEGKNVVIIGRSNIVGKPLAALLLREDCTVTVCHSKSKNLPDITKKADIVVAAIGQGSFFTADYFNSNCIVIDVGISKIAGTNKIIGDVDFKNVQSKVKYITPVPGGVGPMTVVFLLKNTIDAMLKSHNLPMLTDL